MKKVLVVAAVFAVSLTAGILLTRKLILKDRLVKKFLAAFKKAATENSVTFDEKKVKDACEKLSYGDLDLLWKFFNAVTSGMSGNNPGGMSPEEFEQLTKKIEKRKIIERSNLKEIMESSIKPKPTKS